jgi:hypothetical protein
MLREAFGEHCLSQTAVFEWHLHFKVNRVSVANNKRSERIHEDRGQTIHEITLPQSLLPNS